LKGNGEGGTGKSYRFTISLIIWRPGDKEDKEDKGDKEDKEDKGEDVYQ
jgi:hypothetical protein